MAEQEKRMAGNYEITQTLRIGDREVVFGVDPTSDQPYFCALYQKIFEIIQYRERYEECFVSDNFVEVAEQFAEYVHQQCQKVREEWAKVTVPRVRITEEMCIPHDYGQDINGKVVAIKPSALRPEYRSADHQLVLVDGGSGAGANSYGTTCFCVNLYTGESVRWRRYDVLGEVKPECLPDWAAAHAAEIGQQAEQKKTQSRSQPAQER